MKSMFCPECGEFKSQCICKELRSQEKNERNIEFEQEKPAFELLGIYTIAHCSDSEVKVYWSDLKKAEIGDTWEAPGNSQTEIATVLYKDEKGIFIRFETIDCNDYTDYPDVVSVRYYDFGR